MASISTDKAGNRTVQFVGADRKRRSVRLGKMLMKDVQTIRGKVETLNSAKCNHTNPPDHVTAWVKKIGDDLHAKLAAVGLVEARGTSTLGAFLRQYIDRRTDVRPNTRRNLEQSRKYLVAHFGDERTVRSITAADAEAFAFAMRSEGATKYKWKDRSSEATIARVIKHARQFFTFARRGGMIEADPFAEVKPGSMTNEGRLFIVTREATEKLIAAAPSPEWRLIIALSRNGGLRTPSEHLVLTWEDVDWDRGRFLVRSPKTGQRWVPLFPELRPHLEAAFDAAEPGAVYVVTRTRDADANWRTMFEKIIRRAGLLPWERLFQNLRASRETELAADYPLHVVTEWIGNSAPVAARHYLSVTDDDFTRAAGGGAQSGARVVQKPVLTVPDGTRQDSKKGEGKARQDDDLRPIPSTRDDYCTSEQVPLTGVEPVF
jgi:integrase